ncbi:hypothetical protein F2P81_017816 [Scophthalmus maximus]|uniref:MANSC domain-containing protein n=1 Tax=Scophthalmus maximus TaxID=52904 RepID=A0A6A4SC92_SCOMX|nr:hypothetical protein F2P81_017816 [Scophthalmus maximus]
MEDGSRRRHESRPAAAMFPPESSRASQTQFVSTAAAVVVVMMLSLLPVSAVEPETCFSRQHQSVRVNVRLAVNRAGTLMDTRVVASERDCVLVCCSQEVKPGAKCNMAVFNGNKASSDGNCLLFHCPSEQDCPLMKAQGGINTYDIYKASTTFTMKKTNKTSKKQNKTTRKGKAHPVVTTTTRTPPTSTTSLPVVTVDKEVDPRTTDKPELETETTTTTTVPASTTTTTTPPTVPPTTTEPSTTSTTPAASLVIVSKGDLQNSSVSRGKAAAARGALKSGMVVFMVLGLAVLTLALAVGGRKAMESFDRRHYTRLELNDLHYEV